VHLPSFSFYRRAVTPRRDPRPGEIALTDVGHAADWPGAEILYRRGGVVLLRRPPAPPAQGGGGEDGEGDGGP